MPNFLKRLSSVMALAVGLNVGLLVYTQAQAQQQQEADTAQSSAVATQPARVYVFSQDFPSDAVFSTPSKAVNESNFYRWLGEYMQENTSLTMTSNLSEAQYQAYVSCAGSRRCNMINVNILDANRNAVGHYRMPVQGKLDAVSYDLAMSLNQAIGNVQQGKPGSYDYKSWHAGSHHAAGTASSSAEENKSGHEASDHHAAPTTHSNKSVWCKDSNTHPWCKQHSEDDEASGSNGSAEPTVKTEKQKVEKQAKPKKEKKQKVKKAKKNKQNAEEQNWNNNGGGASNAPDAGEQDGWQVPADENGGYQEEPAGQ